MAPPRLIELDKDEQLAELVNDWNFEEGVKFQDRVRRVTNCAVPHASSSPVGSFALLAIFRRYTFSLAWLPGWFSCWFSRLFCQG